MFAWGTLALSRIKFQSHKFRPTALAQHFDISTNMCQKAIGFQGLLKKLPKFFIEPKSKHKRTKKWSALTFALWWKKQNFEVKNKSQRSSLVVVNDVHWPQTPILSLKGPKPVLETGELFGVRKFWWWKARAVKH